MRARAFLGIFLVLAAVFPNDMVTYSSVKLTPESLPLKLIGSASVKLLEFAGSPIRELGARRLYQSLSFCSPEVSASARPGSVTQLRPLY